MSSFFSTVRRTIAAPSLKTPLRFAVIGIVIAFLSKAILDHWQGVVRLKVGVSGFACLAIALGVTLLAHLIAGCVWARILRELQQPVSYGWGSAVYLKTNVAKYLPGNVWHFYGRLAATKQASIPLGFGLLSILLEPLLLVVAAAILAIGGLPTWLPSLGIAETDAWIKPTQAIAIGGMLMLVAPRCLNPLLHILLKLKQKTLGGELAHPWGLPHYPWRPLLGELIFLLLRGTGFLLVGLAISPFALDHAVALYSGFAIAWLGGFVIPGLPGGIGVFEALALALLSPLLPTSDLLGILALYRLINTLAEAIGAALVVIAERRI